MKKYNELADKIEEIQKMQSVIIRGMHIARLKKEVNQNWLVGNITIFERRVLLNSISESEVITFQDNKVSPNLNSV